MATAGLSRRETALNLVLAVTGETSMTAAAARRTSPSLGMGPVRAPRFGRTRTEVTGPGPPQGRSLRSPPRSPAGGARGPATALVPSARRGEWRSGNRRLARAQTGLDAAGAAAQARASAPPRASQPAGQTGGSGTVATKGCRHAPDRHMLLGKHAPTQPAHRPFADSANAAGSSAARFLHFGADGARQAAMFRCR